MLLPQALIAVAVAASAHYHLVTAWQSRSLTRTHSIAQRAIPHIHHLQVLVLLRLGDNTTLAATVNAYNGEALTQTTLQQDVCQVHSLLHLK